MSPPALHPQAFLRVWRPRSAPQLELVLAQHIVYDRPVHVHDELELSFAPLHRMELQLGGARYLVPAGAVTVTAPGEAHRVQTAQAPQRFYGLRVQAQLVHEVWRELGGSNELPQLSPVQMGRALTLTFLRVHHLSGHAPGFDSLALDWHLRELLTLLLNGGHDWQAKPKTRSHSPAAVRQARARLDDMPGEPASLAQLALTAGLSSFHFARLFRAATGLTPHAYILDARIRRAKTLLLTDEPLAQLAASLGFASQSHFAASFRQRVGVTPQQYRQDSRNLVDREKL